MKLMRSKVTIFCYCKQNNLGVSKIAYTLLYKSVEKTVVKNAISKGLENIEIESVYSALSELKNDCYVEIFMLPGKARIKLSLDRSKLNKEIRKKLSYHNVQFYWLRKEDFNSRIDKLSIEIENNKI